MHGRLTFLVSAFTLLLLPCSCGGRGQLTTWETQAPGGVNQDIAEFKSPSALASVVPPQNPLAFYYGRYLHGAYALQQFGCPNVVAEQHRARFTPDWPNAGGMAYAIYCFRMTYYQGDGSFVLDWEGAAPAAGDLYLGLGNFERDCWDWFAPADDSLVVDDLALYVDEQEYLLLAVAVLGEEPVTLNGVQIGERIMQEGVDMSMLCAPVLDFEIQLLKDEWATRSPVAQNYNYITEESSDGMTWAVISHEVDGYTHYGMLRIPPHIGEEEDPVLLLCHPGMGGTGFWEMDWLEGLVNDPAVLDEFFVVIPSFRGEPLNAGDLGSYESDGPRSIYDRDADDAIAMLDCVLANFAQADADAIVAAGWSRGAQVAMRASQRDPRIAGVVEFAGWTDELAISGQAYAYYRLPELNEEPLPGSALYEYDHMLWQLKNGLCEVWDMRQLMLRMSVAYCAADLPAVQIHHGDLDTGVPIEQAENLVAWLEREPESVFEYYRYPEGNHYVGSMEGAGERTREFLASFLDE